MTAPFTASNGYTVAAGKIRCRLNVRTGDGIHTGSITGEETLRALVEYAATIGITAEPSEEA